ncbi:MAG: YkgJ family cysteine cluster protein [Candidatus Sericytochromatia bacterium]|nr:YkgJ family cysteine cluster protein [Candidatus Sericytochromatia bacterium]
MSTTEPPLQLLQAPYFKHLSEVVAQLRRSPQLMLYLESASYRHFACTLCGDCCRQPWEIKVSEAYYRRWADVFAQEASGRFKEAMVLRKKPDKYAFADFRRQPGSYACVFLEPDQSCWIHTHHGEAALSEVCRSYPRSHKIVGHRYESRLLMHSCEAVPEQNARYPELLYRLQPVTHFASQQHETASDGFPGRYETWLLLGLLYDLLEQPLPVSVLARWGQAQSVLQEIYHLGLNRLQASHLHLMYEQRMQSLSLTGQPGSPQDQQTALKWLSSYVSAHPGLQSWLRQLRPDQLPPPLSAISAERFNHHLTLYLRNRLLNLPYLDHFAGSLNLWQHCFLITLQLCSLQGLMLYYLRTEAELSDDHCYRAIQFAGRALEQRTAFKEKAWIESLSPLACIEGIRILLSLDYGQAGSPA